MKRYELKLLPALAAPSEAVFWAECQKLGEEGWQLVQVLEATNIWIFQREKSVLVN